VLGFAHSPQPTEYQLRQHIPSLKGLIEIFMINNKKSPLKANPLRIPEQSLDEEIQSIREGTLDIYLLVPIIIGILCFYEWLLWYQIINLPHPLTFTIIAIGISIYCVFKVKKVIKQLRSLRLGRDGERALGQTLEALRKKGCKIFYEIVGKDLISIT
jgi:hypothetical protein